MTESGHWATLTIRLRGGRVEPAALAEARDHLQDLAALMAMEDGVSGVETRDPKTAPVERGELVVYTEPAHLEALSATAGALAGALGIDVTQRSEVRDDEDWKDAWKAHYRPIVFGQRQLLLRPSWLDRRADDPQLEIVLDPGRAFGTGLHESTALCLDRLCDLATQRRFTRVLDLGCGSGILALSALRLWPELERTQAIDFDPEAVETARENADINDLGARLETTVGTIDVVTDATFDLVIANIRPEVLIPIAKRLREVVSPGGVLVLSGILAEEGDEVAAAYEAAGWRSAGERRTRGEWVGIDLEAP
jgi:ribosomal protein L11 methyltransferase